MGLKWLSIYNKDAWERMVAESCGSQFTNGAILHGARKRIFKKKYAVCVETDSDKDAIIHWTDERDYPLKDGQFLVDADTLAVIAEYGVKEYFEDLKERMRKSIAE